MIRKGYDPITESAYLYCDVCGAMFDIDATDFSHVCEAPNAEPGEADPLGVRDYTGT